VSKFHVLRPSMLTRFNRRDFLCLGALSAVFPIFDVKLPPGLNYTLLNSPTPQKYLIETMPGGVALFDYNNDGLLDIFLVNGGHVTNQMQAQSHVLDNVEVIDHFFHYLEPPLLALNHNGRFERTESGVTTLVAGRGLAFGDLNNDGWLDAVVTVLGGHP
jgi:enediyne biosynthesis protein E4